jgi:hypothetical protein
MKRIAIFAFSALASLWCLAPGSPLYAQNQLAACPLEGPSIGDTLKYINDAIGGVQREGISGYWLALSVDSLVMSYHYEFAPSSSIINEKTAPVYSFDCKASGAQESGGYHLSAKCANFQLCVSARARQDDGTWTPKREGVEAELGLYLKADDVQGDRLARAVSHLIALLQQQYKQSHSDPNDPFAKSQ